jgi:hypothetical protein
MTTNGPRSNTKSQRSLEDRSRMAHPVGHVSGALGRIKSVQAFNCTLTVAGVYMELHAETAQILTSRLCNMMTARSGELYELFYG